MAKLAEQLRFLAFWSVDLLRKRSIRSHFKEIRFLLSEIGSEEIARKRKQYIRDLLAHAVSNCPNYASLSASSELSDFPVVNKNLIKSSQDQFLARGIDPRKIYSVTTSGSTGTPFKTYQDKLKKHRNYADTIYFAGLGGYKIGHRLIYLKIWVEEKMKRKLDYSFQNVIPVDVLRLNDTKIESIIHKMENDHSTFGILGYASALELICQYLDRKNVSKLSTRVKSIIAMSEALNEYTRTTIRKYFGIPVVSRYSNLENGIIAQQELNGSERFLVNTASYHVEILKMDRDEPAGTGELGRIVITDFFNFAMPMIRYDTGDIGAIEGDPLKGKRQYLTQVEGRKLDLLFDTQGELISSYIVYKNMWQYPEIDQYQLVQEGAKQYIFKINTRTSFTKEQQLVNEFKSFLGTDADFYIEYVSEIPLLASGKRRKIVNNYINQ